MVENLRVVLPSQRKSKTDERRENRNDTKKIYFSSSTQFISSNNKDKGTDSFSNSEPTNQPTLPYLSFPSHPSPCHPLRTLQQQRRQRSQRKDRPDRRGRSCRCPPRTVRTIRRLLPTEAANHAVLQQQRRPLPRPGTTGASIPTLTGASGTSTPGTSKPTPPPTTTTITTSSTTATTTSIATTQWTISTKAMRRTRRKKKSTGILLTMAPSKSDIRITATTTTTSSKAIAPGERTPLMPMNTATAPLVSRERIHSTTSKPASTTTDGPWRTTALTTTTTPSPRTMNPLASNRRWPCIPMSTRRTTPTSAPFTTMTTTARTTTMATPRPPAIHTIATSTMTMTMRNKTWRKTRAIPGRPSSVSWISTAPSSPERMTTITTTTTRAATVAVVVEVATILPTTRPLRAATTGTPSGSGSGR